MPLFKRILRGKLECGKDSGENTNQDRSKQFRSEERDMFHEKLINENGEIGKEGEIDLFDCRIENRKANGSAKSCI